MQTTQSPKAGERTHCLHEANEFGTLDNVTGKCWVCGQAGERTQHTPGPWEVRPSTSSFLIGSRTDNIALTRGEDAVDEANARLIAAAPELLNALKWCLDGIEEMRRVGMTEMEGQRAAVFCAIAKAEGTNL